MIDEQAALIEAERHGIRVSDEELAQQIFRSRVCRRTGSSSASSGIAAAAEPESADDEGQFEETLRRSLIVDKLRAALTDWMAVSTPSVEREYAAQREGEAAGGRADRRRFRDQVTVTDADVRPTSSRAQGGLPRRRAAQGSNAAARSRSGVRRRSSCRRPTCSATTTTTSRSPRRRSRCAPATSS